MTQTGPATETLRSLLEQLTSQERVVFSVCVDMGEYAIAILMSLREILPENGADTGSVWAPGKEVGGTSSHGPCWSTSQPRSEAAIECHLGFGELTNAKEMHAYSHGL